MSLVADPGFSRGGGANSKDGCEKLLFRQFFPKNCMKLKEFGPEGVGCVSLVLPLRGAHTERQRQRLIQVNGDAWEWVWDPFSSGTMHSNETLPLTLPLGLFTPLDPLAAG